MTDSLQLVREAYKGWETKDPEILRRVLHENYKAKMPGMEISGIKEAEACIAACPFDSKTENEMYIADGDNVVRIWDMVAEKPVPFRLRMSELNVVQDGKILFNEAFFDITSVPPEIQEMFKGGGEQQQSTDFTPGNAATSARSAGGV